ncbi:MAG TPA: flagellar biosynthesis protein FliO [Pseudolabrys sp.]|nr:flagellar biosynthesis protein FliO [Pseudolabrys sp.]
MFESLFGSEMPLAARFFIAFLVVLALIGLTAWLVRRFGASRLGNTTRGRQPRLAVIDAATVDGRRRLVLIRRDNIEHLLMIGGPTDLVVEPNIVRAVGARDVAREPARVAPAGDTATRGTPAIENGWPLQPAGEPAPASAQRAYRPAPVDEPWLPPEPGVRARPADSLTGLAAELSTRLTPPDSGAPPARSEPAPRPPLPVSEAGASPAQADHNLAEMAHQLEAALRRAPAPEGRPPVTDPLAMQAAAAPGKGADAPARVPQRELKARVEPKFDAKAEPKFEPKIEPKIEPKPDTKAEPRFDFKPERTEPPATPGKNLYENLEEEMASLLGRPPGKS